MIIGNNAPWKIASFGMVRITMFDGAIIILGGVKHVSDLKKKKTYFFEYSCFKNIQVTDEGEVLKVSNDDFVMTKG